MVCPRSDVRIWKLLPSVGALTLNVAPAPVKVNCVVAAAAAVPFVAAVPLLFTRGVMRYMGNEGAAEARPSRGTRDARRRNCMVAG